MLPRWSRGLRVKRLSWQLTSGLQLIRTLRGYTIVSVFMIRVSVLSGLSEKRDRHLIY